MFEGGEIAKTRYTDRKFSGVPDVGPRSVATSKIKRIFDVLFALTLIFILIPTLIAVACAIKTNSKGTILFLQRRTGLNGEVFRIYKFRTMTASDDGDTVIQAREGDARVTRLGRFLRKSSLDELPQLFNILKGDMSFVGPRPHALAHDELFTGAIPFYAQRHQARPGLTGLAQIRGLRGEIKTIQDIEQRLAADIEYIQTWNFMSDVRLILKSIPLLAGDQKAH